MHNPDQQRQIFRMTGADRSAFLQGLITNDMTRLADGPVYAALLTPQGKYLADFFLIEESDTTILLDVAAPLAPPLYKRLSMYRLRADVTIAETDLQVYRGTGPAPAGAHPDPRHPDLGWRVYGPEGGDDGTDWAALRVALIVPESGVELIPEDSFILEAGFERLHGVDFRKGCYVGQEVTARMKHKTTLKKGLIRVAIQGAAPIGTPILTEDGKPAGTLFTQSGGQALAHMRFDRMDGPLTAATARITGAA
ncbi:MAG: YgfZ/GcvT domain-containing protein [Qingshengfaniella sp.]